MIITRITHNHLKYKNRKKRLCFNEINVRKREKKEIFIYDKETNRGVKFIKMRGTANVQAPRSDGRQKKILLKVHYERYQENKRLWMDIHVTRIYYIGSAKQKEQGSK